MFNKLKALFTNVSETEATPRQAPPPRPATPLEILMPEGSLLPATPKLAGKFISYLVASPNSNNTVLIETQSRHVHSTDKELRQFLTLVVGAKQIDALLSECRSIMFSSPGNGAIGSLGCIQQPHFHSFEVVESSPLPNLSWDIRRQTRIIEQAPGSSGAS